MIARVMNPQSITYIQMDNAPSHGVQTQRRLSEYCDTNHLMVQYTTQPAQSPDFNICDLVIFNLKKQTHR